MSALNWAIDMGQSCAIGTLEEKVEALEKDMATARAWVEYLNGRLTMYEEMYKNMPHEAVTDAEKTAYAFGWFKALEVQRNKNGNN